MAIVLGVELNGIGVVRSLARAGVPVMAISDKRNSPGMYTRYGRKYGVSALHGRALVGDLIELARTLPDRPVLLATQEATVQTLAEYREELVPWFRLTLADSDCIGMLADKETFQRFAERNEFRVPKTINVVDAVSLAGADSLRFPVVLKPAKRDATYSRNFKKAYRVENFTDLARLCQKILPVLPDMIVQEWIEGSDSDIYFCLQYVNESGELAASFVGRKIRSWPPHTGGTASCVVAPPKIAKVLTAETTRFFRAAGFTGMGSMEYKRDSITGEFYLIEPTVGRTDFQEEVATLNGVNIPLAAWQSATGASVAQRTQDSVEQPVVWRNTPIDRRSAQLQQQCCGRGDLDSGKTVDGWWRWYDPMPAAIIFWRRIGPAIRKRTKRLGLFKGATE